MIEALFALCRKAVENEPLKIFMAITDLDRNRANPLEAPTVDRLARSYRQFGSQFPIFAEAPSLTDKTILQFLDVAESVNDIRDNLAEGRHRRNNAVSGKPVADLSAPRFAARGGRRRDALENSRGLCQDSECAGTLRWRPIRRNDSVSRDQTPENTPAQDRLTDLLAGAATPTDADSHRQVVQDMMRILEAQRLINIDTLFQIADHLESLTKGEKLNPNLVNKLAAESMRFNCREHRSRAPKRTRWASATGPRSTSSSSADSNLRTAIEKAAAAIDAEKLK